MEKEFSLGEWSEELRSTARELQAQQKALEEYKPVIRELTRAAEMYVRAWSGSNLGYHANVYYTDFQPPPPSAHFSVTWGLRTGVTFQPDRTQGDWCQYDPEEVAAAIYRTAGNPDLDELMEAVTEAARPWTPGRHW